MKNFKKLFTLVLVLVFAGAFLASCDNGSGDGGDKGNKNKITLTVWGSEEDQAMLKEMCADFAKANPQMNINSYLVYKVKLMLQIKF